MKLLWGGLAVLALAGLFWLNWRTGLQEPKGGGYLYAMPSSAAEAGYCLAAMERIREITHGRREAKLEQFVDEQLMFWRARAEGGTAKGRAALARDSSALGVNEGAYLHLAIQGCGLRAVKFYGARFASMGG